ncbi:hypothetical protein [Rugosimonospora africana]|uniref:DUF2637 domain-containing protein n=1 Tax=Rugosimonospora africana TaxID=556532 RepID=A0A8J3QXL9_9ACTN|nr:hypothetical protein [Rugosimonospora africana]GIH18007.1 hypothetical protein Raf01_61790 [Rugosimonospora africana]
MFTDEHLAALTREERTRLARRLAELAAAEQAPAERAPAEQAPADTAAPAPPDAARPSTPGTTRRRWLAVLALAACAAMIPWTARLATTLPERYVTQHWSITWVGFDSVLLLSFAATGWATLRGGRAVWAAAAVTATLLLCDAWFDLTTASTPSDLTAGAVAAAGEIPLAALLLYLAHRPSGGQARPRFRGSPVVARRWAAGTPRPTWRGPRR